MNAATPVLAAPALNRSATGRVRTQMRQLARQTAWLTVGASPASGVHNFTPELLADFKRTLNDLKQWNDELRSVDAEGPGYAVIQSSDPVYFSQGGDLSFFLSCIDRRDARQLRDYSLSCLDALLSWSSDFKQDMTTISLVQGRALGGGFEMALSSDYIIAEEHSSFGFPEIMFGLFPCTGAMGLVTSRSNAFVAERLMTQKKVYTARQLLELGLVDEVCATGEGEMAVEKFIEQHAKRRKARLKIQQSRHRHSALNYEEGLQVVEDWVETAMCLDQDEIRSLEMLILMQEGERPRAAAGGNRMVA
jgi:DSF synthase